MHGLSVSKNDVALDILISRDCLASLCKLLDTGMRPDEAPQNSEELVLNAIDCIWSIVGAQSLISKMTSCYTLLALQITQRMLHAMAGLIKLGTARNDNAKLTADEDKFAPQHTRPQHTATLRHTTERVHRALSHGIDALLTLASIYSPPFRKSMCTPETIDGLFFHTRPPQQQEPC